jgi:hypothetical protein
VISLIDKQIKKNTQQGNKEKNEIKIQSPDKKQHSKTSDIQWRAISKAQIGVLFNINS